MPEMHWTLRWPDGSEDRCYSPSSVITEMFTPGQSYGLPEVSPTDAIVMNELQEQNVGLTNDRGAIVGCVHQVRKTERAIVVVQLPRPCDPRIAD